ncbi:MAG: hypothetical protein ABIH59_00985 [archaeon]
MDIQLFIIQNKEFFKAFYALVAILVSVLIVFKSHKLFRLSSHNGIRYFRNAFFFYGIAFVIRYFLKFFIEESFIVNAFFEFFLVMAGFFLLYSLLWKRFESFAYKPFSSLFNARISLFYALAVVIVILDFLLKGYYFMFLIQILVFLYATILSYKNYKKDNYKHKFPRFYFLAMLLAFFAWILNALAAVYFEWNPLAMMNTYLLNSVFFLLFLYGIIKVTRG